MIALSREAPVDLRVNTLLATRDDVINALRDEKFEVEPTPFFSYRHSDADTGSGFYQPLF